jgi:hypothetical protein
MPKIKLTNKINNIKVRFPVRRKFRIGNRKTGRSALGMSTEELHKVLGNPDQRKYHGNARAVLKERGTGAVA